MRHRFAREVLGLVSPRSLGAVDATRERSSKSPEERPGLEGGLVRRVWPWGLRRQAGVQSPESRQSSVLWCLETAAGRGCRESLSTEQGPVCSARGPEGPGRAFVSSRCRAVLGESPLRGRGPVAVPVAGRVSGTDMLTKSATGANRSVLCNSQILSFYSLLFLIRDFVRNIVVG